MSAEALASFIGAGINFIALVFVAGQVALANRQIKHAQMANDANIVRQRRQATIDYYMSTVDHRAKLAKDLPDIDDLPVVHRFVDELLRSAPDNPDRSTLNRYLGFYETLAVGVAAEVYDLAVLDAMGGGGIRDTVRGYKPYFQAVQAEPERSSWFVELEWLAARIGEMRGENNNYQLMHDRLAK